ncbi:T3SS effector HopA1 family protein [Nonomuraea sp. NPDC049158]|uniref:T3SS effector HopA1 family protein n=1 Tax=Nonomuraea sp. NPDC049158 TaxID=3155649 RepID=UPI0033E67359
MSLWSKLKKATTRKKTRKSGPADTAKGLAGTVVLTKPKRSDSLVDLSPPATPPKAPVNPPSDRAFLENAYQRYYLNGVRTPMANRRKRIYSFMGKGETGYLEHAVTDAEFHDFAADNPDYRVSSQNAKPLDEALAAGDYFHVSNKAYKPRALENRARRIIVNVKTQEAGLKVANALTPLFKDDDVSPYFRKFKIYLSGTAAAKKKVKYDKLVIYYMTSDADVNGSDLVGDRIADTINRAVRPDELDDAFAPFYKTRTPGVAFAEEPKYFLNKQAGSFTSNRRDIIADVIEHNDKVGSADDFIDLVNAAFTAKGVNPAAPHTHLAKTP